MNPPSGGHVCSLCGRPVAEPSFEEEGHAPKDPTRDVVICGACQDRIRAEATRQQGQ